VAGAAEGGRSCGGAYCEPEGVAMEALPERATLGCGDGGVTFFGDGG
jgi:hypothetical protein